MSNLQEHAKAELARIGLTPDAKDGLDRAMYQNIMSVIILFSGQGHSGGTAGYAINILSHLMSYEPITPLTGEDDEWLEMDEAVAGRKMWQNIRCAGRVIKEADGKCYDLEGKVFVDPDGSKWTSRDSWVEVTFPYTLKHEYVDRTQDELGEEKSGE